MFHRRLKFLPKLSISQRFYAIIFIITAVLILQIGIFWSAVYVLSSLRAYVGAEGSWAMSQKASMSSLLRYSTSFKQKDYDDFQSFLDVPLGDKQARLELLKPSPDLSIVREGFIRGENHPADIDRMIFLLKHFRNVNYLQQAIVIWAQGDVLIEKQRDLGVRMHENVSTTRTSNPNVLYERIKPLVAEAVENDKVLTTIEKQLSTILGEAAREIRQLLLYAVFGFTVVFGFFAAMLTLYISRLVRQVDKAKSEFIALASHQLRSPLSVISLSAELLKNSGVPKTEVDKGAIEDILQQVSQMSELIEATLNVSRIELGSLVVETDPIDIMAFARVQVETMQVIAHAKGMSLSATCTPEKYLVPMDAVLLRVIFQNILSNAIKYTPAGGEVHLAVELQASEILISVSDTGPGIPEEFHQHIFSKLYRTPQAQKSAEGGSGLGLYIVKSIVTAAKGRIWFNSREGEGATFFVSLPLYGMKKIKGNVRL
jgi:two-component system, sensor histidine kinase